MAERALRRREGARARKGGTPLAQGQARVGILRVDNLKVGVHQRDHPETHALRGRHLLGAPAAALLEDRGLGHEAVYQRGERVCC